MSHEHGAYLGSVRDIATLRERCVIDQDTECWHFRSARGKPMPRDRRHVVHLFGGTVTTTTRAAWLLSRGKAPAPGLVVYRACESYDCCNPSHLKCGTKLVAQRTAFAAGRFTTPARAAAVRKVSQSQRKLTDELVSWLLASDQTGADLAHALGVSDSRINAIRQRAARIAQMASPFGAASVAGMRPRAANESARGFETSGHHAAPRSTPLTGKAWA